MGRAVIINISLEPIVYRGPAQIGVLPSLARGDGVGSKIRTAMEALQGAGLGGCSGKGCSMLILSYTVKLQLFV
jgi:hypothetical protein